MRISVAAACLSLCLIGFSSAQNAHAAIRKETNIPAEGLGPALNALAKDRNFQIVYVTEEIANVRTDGAIGEFTTEEALKRLLTGTGLTFRYLDDKTVTILSRDSAHAKGSPLSDQTTSDRRGEADSLPEGMKSPSGDFRLVQVDQGKNASTSAVVNPAPSAQENSNGASAGLSEIIVTAQKKSERLQDVPIPVSVVNSEALLASNQLKIQDYYASIPGLNFVPDGLGGGLLAIRGLAPFGGNSTVGIVIDDVPYGSSVGLAGFGGNNLIPDIDPSDLQRIEVLRGPQGTFYGASSMGGLVKFVTVDPSTAGVTGRIEAGTNRVAHGDPTGYGFRGALNLPLSDTLAVRVSGFGRRDPGYVDDIQTGQNGVNSTNADGGHLAALWKPSDSFSIKLSALVQNTTVHGSSYAQVGLVPEGAPLDQFGDLQQATLPATGWQHNVVNDYSLIVKDRVGTAEITFLSGYNSNHGSNSVDFTPIFGPFTQFGGAGFGIPNTGFDGFGIAGTPFVAETDTDKFTEELRLSVPIGRYVDWLVGGFYTHERTRTTQTLYAGNSGSDVVGLVGVLDVPSKYEEYAAFTDLTAHFTSQFDVQFGARQSRNRQQYDEVDTGPFAEILEGAPQYPRVLSSASAFTFLITPQFRLSSDSMVYARLASGYRPGGPNAQAAVVGARSTFDPDKTYNYELGVKGNAFNQRIVYDVSVYYIDWRDIQINLVNPAPVVVAYTTNGGRAKSEGVELSLESRPWTGLTLGGWVAFNNATLIDSLPPGGPGSPVGSSGDRLPLSSRFTGNISFEQNFPITNRLMGFVGAAAAYVGSREGGFGVPPPDTPPRQIFPSYTKTDIRAGARWDGWTVTVFGNNLSDARAPLAGGLGTSFPTQFLYLQPRTIGMSIAKSFN